MSRQLGNEVERQGKANKSTTPKTALFKVKKKSCTGWACTVSVSYIVSNSLWWWDGELFRIEFLDSSGYQLSYGGWLWTQTQARLQSERWLVTQATFTKTICRGLHISTQWTSLLTIPRPAYMLFSTQLSIIHSSVSSVSLTYIIHLCSCMYVSTIPFY